MNEFSLENAGMKVNIFYTILMKLFSLLFEISLIGSDLFKYFFSFFQNKLF